MKKWIIKLIVAFQQWRINADLKSAIKEANRMHNITGKKYMVLYFDGKFNIIEKQVCKAQLRAKNYFKRGVNLKTINESAYYITE